MPALDDSANALVRISIAIVVVNALAVGLRIWLRLHLGLGLKLDDWLIVAATVLLYASTAVELEGVVGADAGGTIETEQMTLEQYNHFTKFLFVGEIMFPTCITAIKASILFFYRRIFPTPTFRRITTTLLVLCIVWAIVSTFLIIFQCSPVSAFWHVEQQTITATCISAVGFLFGLEIVNLVLDIAILVPPIAMVRGLQLSRAKKISVSGIFLLGGFVCVSSIVRIYWIYDPAVYPLARSNPGLLNWSIIQLGAAILCACLPTYAPLITHNASAGRNIWARCKSVFLFRRGANNDHERCTLDSHGRRLAGSGLEKPRASSTDDDDVENRRLEHLHGHYSAGTAATAPVTEEMREMAPASNIYAVGGRDGRRIEVGRDEQVLRDVLAGNRIQVQRTFEVF